MEKNDSSVELISSIVNTEGNAVKLEYIKSLLNCLCSPLFICNKNRDVLFANKALLENEDFKKGAQECCPGHILECCSPLATWIKECDRTKCYKACRIQSCVSKSFDERNSNTDDLILTLNNNKMLGLMFNTSYFECDGLDLVVVSFHDISNKKRLEVSEPLFYHDLTNLSAGLSAYLDVIINYNSDNVMEQLPELKAMADQITDIVLLQREMSRAETDNLITEPFEITVSEIMQDLKDKMAAYHIVTDSNLEINQPATDCEITTDERLVLRILCNMILNGIEHDNTNNTKVTVDVEKNESGLTFSVHNGGYIERSKHHHIFHFGFTTKGRGHGRGTYAMKLIGENILKGKVWFESTPEQGTTFFLRIPEILECEF